MLRKSVVFGLTSALVCGALTAAVQARDMRTIADEAAAESVTEHEDGKEHEWVNQWSNAHKIEKGSTSKLKFGGRIMADYSFFSVDRDLTGPFGADVFQDGFEFRRARIFFEGTIYDRVMFKAQYDIANDSWDFFVYMDGIPVSYVPAAAVAGMTFNLEFSQLVRAGRHIVRATLEQHNRGIGKQWSHAAKVAEEAFVIDISPEGPQASISVRFKENWGGIGKGGPFEFSFQQGSHVSELEAVGGNPGHWPPICEEVEANSNPSKAPGSRLERDLRSCASWDDLWNGTSAPPRSEVREALAMFEYRPVPKGS